MDLFLDVWLIFLLFELGSLIDDLFPTCLMDQIFILDLLALLLCLFWQWLRLYLWL